MISKSTITTHSSITLLYEQRWILDWTWSYLVIFLISGSMLVVLNFLYRIFWTSCAYSELSGVHEQYYMKKQYHLSRASWRFSILLSNLCIICGLFVVHNVWDRGRRASHPEENLNRLLSFNKICLIMPKNAKTDLLRPQYLDIFQYFILVNIFTLHSYFSVFLKQHGPIYFVENKFSRCLVHKKHLGLIWQVLEELSSQETPWLDMTSGFLVRIPILSTEVDCVFMSYMRLEWMLTL